MEKPWIKGLLSYLFIYFGSGLMIQTPEIVFLIGYFMVAVGLILLLLIIDGYPNKINVDTEEVESSKENNLLNSGCD